MALQHPIAVYNAATNAEAQLVRLMLEEAGLEAFVSEDVSPVGLWMFGLLPEIHKPQVWIDQTDVEQAQPLLQQYEIQQHERREADRTSDSQLERIDVICEDCGTSTSFSAQQRGTVQVCPRCSSYVDVPGGEDEFDWTDAEKPSEP